MILSPSILMKLRLKLKTKSQHFNFIIGKSNTYSNCIYGDTETKALFTVSGPVRSVEILQQLNSDYQYCPIQDHVYKITSLGTFCGVTWYGLKDHTELCQLQHYQGLVDNALDPLWVVDKKGFVLSANQTAKTITGDDHPLGRALAVCFTNTDDFDQSLQEAVAMDYCGDVDLSLVSAYAGDHRRITVNIVKQPEVKGLPVSYLVSGRDVTDRIRDTMLYSLESSVYADLTKHVKMSTLLENYCKKLIECIGSRHLVLTINDQNLNCLIIHSRDVTEFEKDDFNRIVPCPHRSIDQEKNHALTLMVIPELKARHAWAIPLMIGDKQVGRLTIYTQHTSDKWMQNTLHREANLLMFVMQHHDQNRRLQLLANVYQQNAEAVVITDDRGVIQDYNASFSKVTGYKNIDLKGLYASPYLTGFNELLHDKLGSKDIFSDEVPFKKENGTIYPARLTVTRVAADDNRYVLQFMDITDEKQQREAISYMANHDLLTGLANRHKLEDELRKSLISGNTFAVLFLDLDKFKEINDTYGHQAGDALLVDVAERLRGRVRNGDLVARWGGDEFVILALNISQARDALIVAQAIINSINQPFHLSGPLTLNVTTSIGIAAFPNHGHCEEILFRHADQALYQAKKIGRNQACLYEESIAETDTKIHLESALRESLAKQEMSLQFQPLYLTKNRKIIGSHVHLKWSNPYINNFSKNDINSVASQCNILGEIGDWVMVETIERLSKWQKEAPETKLIVTIPFDLIAKQSFISELSYLCKHYKINKQTLHLAITETDIVRYSEILIPIMHTLIADGIQMGISNFGMEASCFNYLKIAPLNFVILDSSFVNNIAEDVQSNKVLMGVITFCRNLGLQIITDGVNFDGPITLLRKMNCDYYMGNESLVDSEQFENLLLDVNKTMLPK